MQQLGRGAGKILLDGAPGDTRALGDCMVGLTAQLFGRVGHNSSHAIVVRGDATGVGTPYTMNERIGTTLAEWGGLWRCKQVDATVNNLIFEINPSRARYKERCLADETLRFLSHRWNYCQQQSRSNRTDGFIATARAGQLDNDSCPPRWSGLRAPSDYMATQLSRQPI